jgi:hypothetical protein
MKIFKLDDPAASPWYRSQPKQEMVGEFKILLFWSAV